MKTDALVRTASLPRIQELIDAGGFDGRLVCIVRPGGWSVVRCDLPDDAARVGQITA